MTDINSVTDALRKVAILRRAEGRLNDAAHFDGAADTIDTLRARLAEAQRDSKRLDWLIEQCAYVVSDPDCCDGYWLNYRRNDGTLWTQATEHETPRAAIDAANRDD